MKKNLILIVDDEKETKKILFEGLSKNGYMIFLAENAERALHLFEQNSFDLVIINTKLPDKDGLDLLDIMKSRSVHTHVMMMASFGTIQNAVEAMKRGALDYLPKPVPLEMLQQKIQMILNQNLSHHEIHPEEEDFSNTLIPIMTSDKRMREAIDLCQRIAPSKAPVLIQGESGTGKELFARYIHAQSPRGGGPFVAVNCASLPETLFESELFGYEKGAFSGASSRKKGRIELANNGTLFLDEIGEMSLTLQAKLLRVLQEKQFVRLGGLESIKIDFRLIAATNKDLKKEIEDKKRC